MTDPATTTEEVRIPVLEERLDVSTREVETGHALRLRKQVQEVPVDIAQPLRHDVIETRRVPVGRVIEAAPEVRHEGELTIVPVVEERIVTRTELVLVEEIHIRRRTEVRQDTQQATLRRESVVIERWNADSRLWIAEEEF